MSNFLTLHEDEAWSAFINQQCSGTYKDNDNDIIDRFGNRFIKSQVSIRDLEKYLDNSADDTFYVFYLPVTYLVAKSDKELNTCKNLIADLDKSSGELFKLINRKSPSVKLIALNTLSQDSSIKDVNELTQLEFDKVNFNIDPIKLLVAKEIISQYRLSIPNIELIEASALKAPVVIELEMLVQDYVKQCEFNLIVNDLEAVKKKAFDERRELIKQLDSRKLENESLQLQLSKVQERFEANISEARSVYQNKIKDLESKISSSEQRNKRETKNLVSDYEAKVTELKSKISDAANCLEAVQRKLSSEKSENNKLRDKLFLIQEKLEKVSIEGKNKINYLRSKIKKISDDTESELKKLREFKDSEFEKKLLEIEAERNSERCNLEKRIEDKEVEISRLSSAIERIEIEKNDTLSSIKKEHQRSVLFLSKQKDREITKLKAHNDKLTVSLDKIKALNGTLSRELEEIKHSMTWKALSPVRKVTNIVSKSGLGASSVLKNDIALLYTSEYFDPKWYLENYQDVASEGIDPAEHYLKYGYKEGRRPSMDFDGQWYLTRYEDVAQSDINPLIHFIKFGKAEGRKVSPKMLTQTK